ncbi:MAG: hypothetical protein NC411_09705 [Bacteroides sp.]|nr:hypothetical protein [Bacteroides sp.]
MNTKPLLFMTFLAAITSCSTAKMTEMPAEAGGAIGWDKRHVVEETDSTTVVAIPQRAVSGVRGGGRNSAYLPKARIYKTNGDYADYVPVTLNASRTSLVSFPAPTDLRDAEPVKLDDGFLLDRRGVGPDTAFTRWTYKEYSAMKSAPTPAEIMDNLIPDARVTEVCEMPFTTDTPNITTLCNDLIRQGVGKSAGFRE